MRQGDLGVACAQAGSSDEEEEKRSMADSEYDSMTEGGLSPRPAVPLARSDPEEPGGGKFPIDMRIPPLILLLLLLVLPNYYYHYYHYY